MLEQDRAITSNYPVGAGSLVFLFLDAPLLRLGEREKP